MSRAELYTIAESLLAAVAAHTAAPSSASFSMLSQSPARSPLALPTTLPAAVASTAGGAMRPSAARRFEGKEARRHSHDLRAAVDHHHPHHPQLDGERERDRRGRDNQVKGLKK